MTAHPKDVEDNRKYGLRSTWRICEVCNTEFLAKTATVCYECKRRLEQTTRRNK